MKEKQLCFKIFFSLVFLSLSLFIMFSDWAKSNINKQSIFLILLSFLPWVKTYIKSLEINGIGKIELISSQEKKSINKIVDQLNLDVDLKEINNFESDILNESNTPIFLEGLNNVFSARDVLTKLVLTRFELLKLIELFCHKYKISTRSTIPKMTFELFKNDIIGSYQYNAINKIIPILNKAVHSDIKNLTEEDINWAIDKGIDLLTTLEIAYKSQLPINKKTLLSHNHNGKI